MPDKKKIPRHFRFLPDGFTVDDGNYEGMFLHAPYKALYDWGFEAKPASVDEAGAFLHSVAERFTEQLAATENKELLREHAVVPLEDGMMRDFLYRIPFAVGAEYVTADWLSKLWRSLHDCFALEIKDFSGTVALYLAEKSQHSEGQTEKIFFHLVENRKDRDYPFSLMVTYSFKDEDGRTTHMPVRYAFVEYQSNRKKTLELHEYLRRAGEASPLVAAFIRRRMIFEPITLSCAQAYSLLKDIPAIEKAGIVCRIPDWWRKKKHRISLSLKLDDRQESLLGLDTIIQVKGYLSIDGMELTEHEVETLLRQTNGLAFIKGKWVELDHEKLLQLLAALERYDGGMSLLDALHLGMTSDNDDDGNGTEDKDTPVTNNDWLLSLFQHLRVPLAQDVPSPPPSFTAKLRSYQQTGYAWISRMARTGFGACLADDMGLGKTVQVLAFLEMLRATVDHPRVLLLVPASLLGNWQKECAKFAPQMKVSVLHGTAQKRTGIDLHSAFLYITTYTMVSHLDSIMDVTWDALVLDEAQAIKNPVSKQTKYIKSIPCRYRLAMTGTPVENDLTNLWSLFDFLNKGLLGSAAEFKDFCHTLHDRPEGYAKLRSMVAPFLLRRLKTDTSIISDLPEKIEMVDYVSLSKKQRTLYKGYVDDVERLLEQARREHDDTKRRGVVLASLIKLKQICNHPDQFTGGGGYAEADSGKFALLRDICASIYEKRERVLVFSQFKESCLYLDAFLAKVFGMKGFVLHGGTSVARRSKMVEEFQGERYVPYMVISVKAGGTGLTLTKANHVIHFDRWWNPAVENQATDRAFRIGQTKNVLVHKMVCRGTIEEKINELIERKKDLAHSVIGDGTTGGEKWLTDLNNSELLSLFRLESER